VEPLESRRLLSTAAANPVITPSVASVTADRGWYHGGWGGFGGGGFGGGGITNPTPASSALTPSQVAGAYSTSQSSTSGAGETIAIVDAYNDPNIQADLAKFDAQYGLPAASLNVYNQGGQTTGLPATDPGWSQEIALDVEWAHAAAPGAKLVLVEANSASVSDLMSAVQTAAKLANVVTMSWGSGEFPGETAYDSVFANPKVTFVAASGDGGGAGGAQWPASSPYVVGVGGTTLSAGSSETAWSASGSWWSGYSGSGGGTSAYESVPSYQAAVLGAGASMRSTPDVSAVANPSTGLSVYDSVPGAGATGWSQVGGTSAGAPIWAGIIAAADQARGTPMSSTQTLSLLYGLAGKSATYAAAFHDVTSGSNFAGSAAKGYDVVTGLGTPIASKIVAAAGATPAATSTTAAVHTPVTAAVTASRPTLGPQAVVVGVSSEQLAEIELAALVSLALDFPTFAAPVVTPPPAAPAAPSSLAPSFTVPVATAPPPRAAQPLLLAPQVASLALSDDDGSVPTARSDWRREPGLYIEPPEAPRMLFEPYDLMAREPSPAAPPWWAVPDAAADVDALAADVAKAATTAPPVADPEVSPAIVSGAVALAWGVWEYRSRRADRDRRRAPSWGRPSVN
jgi:hypothetical protein